MSVPILAGIADSPHSAMGNTARISARRPHSSDDLCAMRNDARPAHTYGQNCVVPKESASPPALPQTATSPTFRHAAEYYLFRALFDLSDVHGLARVVVQRADHDGSIVPRCDASPGQA